MAPDVWFGQGVAHGLASGPVNRGYLAGILALAKAQTLEPGYPAPDA